MQRYNLIEAISQQQSLIICQKTRYPSDVFKQSVFARGYVIATLWSLEISTCVDDCAHNDSAGAGRQQRNLDSVSLAHWMLAGLQHIHDHFVRKMSESSCIYPGRNMCPHNPWDRIGTFFVRTIFHRDLILIIIYSFYFGLESLWTTMAP